ncbi:MAG: cupredoxin domain-containing protein [Candidatus Kerfeldbacteria bacterium]|nr:cupredoxin domain-containing protein [Candidatus Kerfeldbacteria bacterium]
MKYVIGIVVGITTLFVALMVLIPNQKGSAADGSNVTVENGVQIIDLTAKGGYSPNKTVAKAGMPTKLEVATDGTFDCSSTILIPSLSVTKQLPSSGTTEVDLGTPQVGSLNGTCGMGMYRFEIDFQG